jgi:hypothetical protein
MRLLLDWARLLLLDLASTFALLVIVRLTHNVTIAVAFRADVRSRCHQPLRRHALQRGRVAAFMSVFAVASKSYYFLSDS